MKIIIAGAAEVGTHLAKLLSSENMDVTLMAEHAEQVSQLTFLNLMTVVGSPTSIASLKEAEVPKADLFIAVTPNESVNIHACILAANLGARRTVARIDSYEMQQPANREFYRKIGISRLVYPEMLGGEAVAQAIRRPWARMSFDLCDGQLLLLTVKVYDGAPIVGQKLMDIGKEHSQYHIAAIKRGEGGRLWQEEPGDSEREKKRKANKRRHKDTDARWTKKRGETFFGYKNHTKVCRKTKLIHGYDTTAANVHDSQRCASLIDENDRHEDVWLDSGYVGQEAELEEKRVNPIISDRPYRDHPLTEEQKQSNRTKSKVRCRIEHVFGFMEQTMGGLVFRGIGLVRAAANVALTNLVYNMCRFTQIVRYHVEWIKPKNAAVVG